MIATRGGALLLCLALSGCAALGIGGAKGGCPAELVPSDQLPEGLWRGRLRMGKPGRIDESKGMDLIVQSRDGALTLVGLTPFGTRAFALVQRGVEVEIDDTVARRLGVRPIWVLDALHRSRWIEPPAEQQGRPAMRWLRGDEEIEQLRGDTGHGDIRRFRPAGSGDAAGEDRSSDSVVVVEYAGESVESVHIVNPWCGYEARIQTASEAGPQ